MAESELSIPYRSRIGNAGLVVTGTLVPVWAIMSPLVAIGYLGFLIKLALFGGAEAPADLLVPFVLSLVVTSLGLIALIKVTDYLFDV